MVIEKFNENWIKQFVLIKDVLKENLSKIISIEHVGSTSIKGMYAKPIIDIDIIINNGCDFEITKNELELMGYYHNGDQGVLGREVFKRNNIIQNKVLDKIKHHLYVCNKDNEELNRHILFRDFLNKHEEKVFEYNSIKLEILSKYGKNNREKYVEKKENEYKWFFDRVLEEAEKEIKKRRNYT